MAVKGLNATKAKIITCQLQIENKIVTVFY